MAISKVTKQEIARLLGTGKSCAKIAALTGVSASSVQKFKRQLKSSEKNETDSFKSDVRQGVEEGIAKIRSRESQLESMMWDLVTGAVSDVEKARNGTVYEDTNVQSLAAITKTAASMLASYVELSNTIYAIDAIGHELELSGKE